MKAADIQPGDVIERYGVTIVVESVSDSKEPQMVRIDGFQLGTELSRTAILPESKEVTVTR